MMLSNNLSPCHCSSQRKMRTYVHMMLLRSHCRATTWQPSQASLREPLPQPGQEPAQALLWRL